MTADIRPYQGTWERYWEWASIVSMLRLQPETWVVIGSGQLTPELERELAAHIHTADHWADAATYEVRPAATENHPCAVEARLVRPNR